MDGTPNISGRRHLRLLHRAVMLVACFALAFAATVALRESSNAAATLAGGGPFAQVTAGGVTLSVRAAPGPYFLSELLATEVILANRSQTTYTLQGVPATNDCGQTMGIAITGGQAPHYISPVRGSSYCPILGTSVLKPGQTWTIEQFLPLTASGNITLTATAYFLQTETGSDGDTYMTGGDGPFAGRWPTLHLLVASTIPADRTLTLDASRPHHVTVSGPRGALAHLFNVYEVTCHSGQGSTLAPSYTWRPMIDSVLTQAECPGNDVVWIYSIGAPGYAIASGSYSADG